MKKHILRYSWLFLLVAGLFSSCKYFGGGGREYETAEGVADIVGELNNKFGEGASYTDISMSFHKDLGTSISAKGTKDPASKKLIDKLRLKGIWEDKSEITLEIEGDAKAADFMFTLSNVDNLKKIPDLVKQSTDKIKKEKNIDAVVTNVSISAPERINSPEDKLRYMVMAEPKTGGTNFTLIYDDKGNFKNMLY